MAPQTPSSSTSSAKSSEKTESVRVIVRCRPFNERETLRQATKCVEIDQQSNQVTLTKNNEEPQKSFSFDGVFDMNSTQEEVFEASARPIVESVMDGYNGTVFCYGQTGSGKTHTMEGKAEPVKSRGLIYSSVAKIFEIIEQAPKNITYLVNVSMIEIYNEEIRDLLIPRSKTEAPAKLQVKETPDGIQVKTNSVVVKEMKDIVRILSIGSKHRAKGATLMNPESSRSHSIFMVTVDVFDSTSSSDKKKGMLKQGKLNLVDLAGSEKQSQTGATGETFKEAIQINKSLTTLGLVIVALVQKSKHVPYRDSKLTRLLQDALGGNTKTVMVANFSPASINFEETGSTLRYANRAKYIQNKPKINEDPKDALLKDFQEQIEKLKQQLAQSNVSSNTTALNIINEEELQKLKQEKEAEKQQLIEEMKLKSEEEKKALIEEQLKIEKEKERIENELTLRHSALEQERKNKERIQAKLLDLESKFVHGGQLEQVNQEQRQEIVKQKQELEEKERAALQLRRQMEEQQERNLIMEEKYSSIQDEVQVKTRKLKKLWTKFESAKAEISDLQKEFQQEREEYLETIRQLEKEAKLKSKMVEYFIPPSDVKKIEQRAVWMDDIDDWRIQSFMLAGNFQQGRGKPVSATGSNRAVAYSVMGNSNPRYRYQNVIDIGMEMPERTTLDYMYYLQDANRKSSSPQLVSNKSTRLIFEMPTTYSTSRGQVGRQSTSN